MRRAAWWPRGLLLVAVAGGALVGLRHREHLDPTAVDAWVATFGAMAPVAHVMLYAAGAVVFLPGAVFALAGGALFGPLWGTVFNLLGATTGATVAFLVARHVARDWVAAKAGPGLQRLIAGVDAEGWRFVAFVRLVPLFPFTLTNYALGLSRIGLLPYVAASLACMLPGAVAYTWLGYAGRGALAGDAAAIRHALLALGALATLVFVSRLLARRRRAPTDWVGPEDLHRRLGAGAPVTVLDVRGPEEFDGPLGHIPGALNVPLGDLERRLEDVRGRARDGIVLVCRTDKRSAAAAATLRAGGMAAVSVLRDGMEGWTACGFETARGRAGVAPANGAEPSP